MGKRRARTIMTGSERSASSADGVAWDLGDLYAGADDPRIERGPGRGPRPGPGVRDGLPRARSTSTGGPTPGLLLAAVVELEALYEQMDRPAVYASLLHAAKTDDPKHGALLARTSEQRTAINKHLIFFDLEWVQLADDAGGSAHRGAGAGPVPPLPGAEAAPGSRTT